MIIIYNVILYNVYIVFLFCEFVVLQNSLLEQSNCLLHNKIRYKTNTHCWIKFFFMPKSYNSMYKLMTFFPHTIDMILLRL